MTSPVAGSIVGNVFPRVIEPLAGVESSLDSKGQNGAGAPAKVLLDETEIRALRKSGVIDPLDPAIIAQEFGYGPGVFDVALHSQRERFDPLQQQECA
jgi:hypothetical protein